MNAKYEKFALRKRRRKGALRARLTDVISNIIYDYENAIKLNAKMSQEMFLQQLVVNINALKEIKLFIRLNDKQRVRLYNTVKRINEQGISPLKAIPDIFKIFGFNF